MAFAYALYRSKTDSYCYDYQAQDRVRYRRAEGFYVTQVTGSLNTRAKVMLVAAFVFDLILVVALSVVAKYGYHGKPFPTPIRVLLSGIGLVYALGTLYLELTIMKKYSANEVPSPSAVQGERVTRAAYRKMDEQQKGELYREIPPGEDRAQVLINAGLN